VNVTLPVEIIIDVLKVWKLKEDVLEE